MSAKMPAMALCTSAGWMKGVVGSIARACTTTAEPDGQGLTGYKMRGLAALGTLVEHARSNDPKPAAPHQK